MGVPTMNPHHRPRNNPPRTSGQATSSRACGDGARLGMYGGSPSAMAAKGGRHLQPLGANNLRNKGRKGLEGEMNGRHAGLPWLPNRSPNETGLRNNRDDRRVLSRHIPAGHDSKAVNGHGGMTLPLNRPFPGGADRFQRSQRGQAANCDLKFEVWNFASPAVQERPHSGSAERANRLAAAVDDEPRTVSLPEVGKGSMTAALPSIVPNGDIHDDEEQEDAEDTLGYDNGEDDDVVLDDDNDGNSSDSGEEEVTDASGTVALGQDEAVATSEKSERKPQRRRKLLLEFPSVPDDFSLFPATIMQEHAIIDTRLALAQQRTLHGVDSGANPELCQGVDNIVRSFAIRGPLDCQLLEKALRQEVAKRPVMRLVFYQYRDQIFCRPPKDVPELHLERELSGKPSEAIGVARRRPFPVQLYPIDREELEREDLIVDGGTTEAETSVTFMQQRKLEMLSEEGNSKLVRSPTASDKHVAQRKSALRCSGVNAFSSQMSIVDLDEVQVTTTTKARRIGSALKRRTSSNVILTRGDSLHDITEHKPGVAGPLSSQQAPSLMSIAGIGFDTATTAATSNSSSSMTPKQGKALSDSHRSMVASQTALADTKIEANLWLRAKVISTSTQEHVLVLSAPTFTCDYWSMSMFIVAVSTTYSRLEQQALDDKRASSNPTKRTPRRTPSRAKQLFGSIERRQVQSHSIHDHYSKTASSKAPSIDENNRGPTAESVSFQEVALREAETLQLRPRTKLWELWEGQATLTVLTRQGKKKVKAAPVLQLPVHVRGETARRTALLRSARTRTGACDVGGTFTSFKFLKLDEGFTERFQRSLPASVWQRISADNPLYLMSLGLFVVLMARCSRGWNGTSAGGQASDQHQGVWSGSRLGTLSEGTSQPLGRREMRPPSSRPQQMASSRRYQDAAPPGAGYFVIGVPLQVRDLSPSQMSSVFGPMSNDACIKVMLPSYKTFCDLLVGLERSLKATRKQVHFPFSSICDELGIRGGLPVSFSFLRRRQVQCLTNPERFYFTETAVGVPGQGLARFGNQCYLQPENGQLRDHCHLELLLWEMLENESVRGGFRFQPKFIRPSYVDGLAAQLTHLVEVVADNPAVSLQELAESIQPPFTHRRGADRQRSASRGQW